MSNNYSEQQGQPRYYQQYNQDQSHGQYQPPSGPPPQQQQQFDPNNPWSAPQPGSAPGFSPHAAQTYSQYQQQAPPSDTNFSAPRRTDTFKEEDFVPREERGEQREALQDYGMRKMETQEDRDLEALTSEFSGIDSSLVAAIYGDTRDVNQARRALQQLS